MDNDQKAKPAADENPAQSTGRFKQTYFAEHGDSPATRAVLRIFDEIGRKIRDTAEVERVQPFLPAGNDFLEPDDVEDEGERICD